MRFSLFIHMERIDEQQPQGQLYEEMVDLCQLADRSGFSTIWTGEHHGMNYTIAPNPLLNLVDLHHRTENVRLGTSTIVAPFWHPIRLAGEIAMADIITGGRLEIGIARGAYSYEYERIGEGIDAWGAGQKLREMIPALLCRGPTTNEPSRSRTSPAAVTKRSPVPVDRLSATASDSFSTNHVSHSNR